MLPPDAIVIEGESFVPENKAWESKDHWNNLYTGYPSGGKMLVGNNATLGTASTTFDLATGDTYHLWVRYVDRQNRPEDSDAFTVTVAQNGKTLSAETLNKTSLRTTAEGQKEWGKGWGQFVWQCITFTADKGSVTLTLGKPTAKFGYRVIDLFIVATDAQYQADEIGRAHV